jgi:hypothetical protein
MEENMYSVKSKTTKEVCERLGFISDIHFVKTMKRNNKIYVSGTCGKEHEFLELKKAAKEAGYIYSGLFA